MAADEAALIAVVDEDPFFVDLLGEILAEEGYRLVAYDRDTILAGLRREPPALLFFDLHHRQAADDWAFLATLRRDARARELPVIVCSTDEATLRARETHLREWRCATLLKPFDLDDLLGMVRAALDRRDG